MRYWSWLFAAPESRAALLGIYAFGAELQALTDPATEASVARLKLAWWNEEMQRLAQGRGVHPISAYLAALPRAGGVDFTKLVAAVGAAAAHVGGVPLECAADLEPHAQALWGGPLALVASFGGEPGDAAGVELCTRALAAAQYLSATMRDYRREARAGRVPFAVDELMAAGINNADLAADTPPPHLQRYLDALRARAADYFAGAAPALPPAQRARQRHLLVAAALGAGHLRNGAPALPRRRLQDMLLAWNAARRA